MAKYCDHLPLYRQSDIYEREGIELDRSTLAGWVGAASRALEPLVEALRRYVMSAVKLHGDDTPVPVLAPGNGRTKTGRLWTYVRDNRPAGDDAAPAVWFAYSPDRKGEHPERHLRNFKGALQAGSYAGFNRVCEKRVQETGCWAHVRRKFFDLHQAHASPLAAEAIERIGQLYAIESEIRGRSPGEWLEASLAKLSRKSETAVAIRYAVGRWAALTRYCEDGRLEIDNNAAERALRAVALGRKNYLFAGSDAGGERAAAMYSLIGSAKLNGLDPEAYLRDVLARRAQCAREDVVLSARRRLHVTAHSQHRFECFAAHEEGVEPRHHSRKVDIRIQVIVAVGSRNVAVEAHCDAESDKPHSLPLAHGLKGARVVATIVASMMPAIC